MLNDKICKKREELNKSIEEKRDYQEIYKISVELDELIAQYYNLKKENSFLFYFFTKYSIQVSIALSLIIIFPYSLIFLSKSSEASTK